MALLIISFVGILAIFSSIVIDNISPNIIYEAEELPSQSGQVVQDINASGGAYRFASATDGGAVVFGPYIKLPKGEYIATFRLNAPEGLKTDKLATIDIVTARGKTIKNHTIIYNQDFENHGSYQSFELPFRSGGESDFEFRVLKYSGGSLSVDSITISPLNVTDIYKTMLFKSIKIILVMLGGLILAQKIRRKLQNNIQNILKYILKYGNIIIFFFVFLIYILVILESFGPLHGITGDEPHYLLTTYSIIHDNDIYISNNYLNEDYKEFFPHQIRQPHIVQTVGGEWISAHEIGLSVLLVIPYYLLGILGVKLFLAIIAALIIVNTFILIKEILQNEKIAFLVCSISAVTSPLLFYSYSIYPETIAAFILIYSTRILIKTFNNNVVTDASYAFCGIMIAFLPWLGIKYISLMLPLLLLFVIFPKNISTAVSSIFVPVLISSLAFAHYMLSMFGSLSPASRYLGVSCIDYSIDNSMQELLKFGTGVGPGHFSLYNIISPSHLATYLFDQQVGLVFYSPIYILSLIGLILLFSSLKHNISFKYLFALLFPASCYFFMYVASGAYGGGSPLSRPMVAILPIIIILLSIGMIFALQKNIITTIDSLIVLSLGIAYSLIKNPGSYIQFWFPDLYLFSYNIIDSPFVDLSVIFPSFITEDVVRRVPSSEICITCNLDSWTYLLLWIMLFIFFASAEYKYRQRLRDDN